jgi:hypothetical protein
MFFVHISSSVCFTGAHIFSLGFFGLELVDWFMNTGKFQQAGSRSSCIQLIFMRTIS